MQVILLEKVENLGNLGDQVKVRPGYARNYLLPQGKATMATRDNVERFEKMRAELEQKAAEALAEAQRRRESLEALGGVTVTARASQEGKLYGSVGTAEVAEAVAAGGVPIEKREVRLPEGPLRTLGEHEVQIHLHSDIDVPLQVSVVAEGL